MLVKFFKGTGKGGSKSPINYLLGEFGTVNNKMPTKAERDLGIGRRSVKPLVLRGDVDQTANLIDSLSFARNYTSGCLTFSEADLANKTKEQLMNSFENAIFSGLDNDQYDVLWIEHRDKGRLELNFLILLPFLFIRFIPFKAFVPFIIPYGATFLLLDKITAVIFL